MFSFYFIVFMKKKMILASAVICVLGLVFSCATNPLTGKKSLNFVSNSELFPSSFQQYGTFLKENKVISGTSDAKRVENVGIKIRLAAEKYLTSIGQSEYLKDVFFLRGGVFNFQKTLADGDTLNQKKVWIYQPGAGAGFKLGTAFYVDYAFTNLANQSNPLYTHIVSLRLDLMKPKNQKKNK